MTRFAAVLIDDSEADRYLAKRMLRRSGVVDEVLEFEDGLTAARFLREPAAFERWRVGHQRPTLFFVDINMPVMNGFELLDVMAGLCDDGMLDVGTSCSVILLTSSRHPDDQERAGSNRIVSEYINKPLTRAKLQEAIDRWSRHAQDGPT